MFGPGQRCESTAQQQPSRRNAQAAFDLRRSCLELPEAHEVVEPASRRALRLVRPSKLRAGSSNSLAARTPSSPPPAAPFALSWRWSGSSSPPWAGRSRSSRRSGAGATSRWRCRPVPRTTRRPGRSRSRATRRTA